MDPSMFNNLPDPLRLFKVVLVLVCGTCVLAVLGGVAIGYLFWGKQ
jgi:hypothetical protein